MGLKRMEPARVKVGEYNFYITPFGAFKAANLTGELASVLAPLLGAFVPLVSDSAGDGRELLDVDASQAAEALAGCTAISGDKLESLARKLLLGGNVVVELEDPDTGETDAQRMDSDIADEVFCGDVQDMFVLCFHVIKLNFNGFFRNLGAQFGKEGTRREKTPRAIL